MANAAHVMNVIRLPWLFLILAAPVHGAPASIGESGAPLQIRTGAALQPAPGGPRGGGCPSHSLTYVDPVAEAALPDNPNDPVPVAQFNLFGGIVETEIFAASYTVPASEFPVTIDRIEFGFGQINATVTTVTHYSMIVYRGNPDGGDVVATYSSDGFFIEHVELPPGNQGKLIQFEPASLGPPLVVTNDGSDSFSIGIRIDAHNSPPATSCNGGLTPARCCDHDPALNAFPLEDDSGIAAPNDNWLYASDCGIFAFPEGWYNTSNLPGGVGLSGDWVIRVIYTPSACPGAGACCAAATGLCRQETEANCLAAGDTFQGESVPCTPNPCPEPAGACCRADGTCEESVAASTCAGPAETFFVDTSCPGIPAGCPDPAGACCVGGVICYVISQSDCDALSGTFQGVATACPTDSSCNGACCNPDSGFCSLLDPTTCVSFNGQYQGIGTACAGPSNNMCPVFACCLADAGCVELTPFDCDAMGGEVRTGLTCVPDPCPIPQGACCLTGGGCVIGEQIPCEGLGNTWAGPGTTCPDACAAPCPGADGDVNEDGSVNGNDIEPFAAGLLGDSTPAILCRGDFDESGTLTVADIPGMVNALLTP